MPNRAARDILGTDKDQELLQSFVRVGIKEEDDEIKISNLSAPKHAPILKFSDFNVEIGSDRSPRKSKSRGNDKKRKRNPRQYFEEVYTDKDRAAAVSFGNYDLKQHLNMKRAQDRNAALQLPDEADPNTLLTLGMKELKNGNMDIAVIFISKALDLNPNDINALVARSKCYLLLGEPAKSLQDAETALISDKLNIRAIYQKAESLYYLGQFEHSLMFFHRGLRLRPELASFRLGIQKTQEAIENTIGEAPKPSKKPTTGKSDKSTITSRPSTSTTQESRSKHKMTKADNDKKTSRRLLGELCVDKEYLENLLKNPNLKRADTETESISVHAKEAVNFLNVRQEFYRQQRPNTALSAQTKPASMY